MSERRNGPPGPLLGQVLELEVGGVAHGGACVARHGDPVHGRAVFVRHALPGERVRARVTEDRGGAFCFADAVEILRPAAGRVAAPCRFAGAGRCGGCDWQHADADTQRALKGEVVRDQFRRLAHLDVSDLLPGAVRELPGGLLGWRTRALYAVDGDGRPGLRRHASHTVEHVDRCLLGAPGVGDAAVLAETWPGLTGVEVVRDPAGDVTTLAHTPGAGRQARGRRPPDRVSLVEGPSRLTHDVAGHLLGVDPAGFWQVHPAALDAFLGALLAAVAPRPGERVLDLYAGAGALTVPLAEAVGPVGSVTAVESSAQAVADAQANLAGFAHASVLRARVDPTVVAGAGPADVVVLDPPRSGAGRQVMAAVVELGPRAIGYVACDPAALARDVGAAHGLGWQLSSLTAFDAFPMTHHVECVALLEPTN